MEFDTFAARRKAVKKITFPALKKQDEGFVCSSAIHSLAYIVEMEPSGYLPVIMQSLVALGFVALVLIVVPMLGPKRKSKNKNENFECGIESQGNARFPVSIKYLMTAILFVLFDVEVIFFYPFATIFQELKANGQAVSAFMAVLMFVGVFLIGFVYVLRKGAFEWDK